MNGTLLDFNPQLNEGTISGEDGKLYHFSGSEWKAQIAPARGQQLNFVLNESNQATAIELIAYQQQSNLSQTKTANSEHIQAEKSYGFMDWSMKCLKNYVNFSGRARRKEFWYFFLFQFLLGFGITTILSILGINEVISSIVSVLVYLALFLPAWAVGARRLHDVNLSGWWLLISLTIIGFIPLLIWAASETKPISNKWGEPAK